ncbi:phage portal protein, HK97 family [Thermanaeromonas toyohensis ToBE]|uniref:Phage portal protein, HK97 family n=1 Tax=Thermanaeromonas toyohensis ToBE TaxID=698762 RepID=A0A1W1VX65_9FIRM|nr:phage portal protein [Thermanaeromonas toyohensis]SMB97972.1 phage portal protein, HK97 family [Thermanaeromonas toyohensis ToBE]
MSVLSRFMDKIIARSIGRFVTWTWQKFLPPEKKTIDFLRAYTYWTYACVRVIAENVASVPYRLYRKTKNGDWEPVEQHPVLDLLGQVNPWMTEFELRELTQIHLELVGEAWWVLERNRLGQPAEIWPLVPAWVYLQKDPEKFLSYVEYRPPGGSIVRFPPEDVIRLRCTHPYDYYRGWSATRAAALPLDIHQYAQEWVRNFFFNDATPAGILTTDQPIEESDANRLRAQWEAGHKGVAKAHRIAVLGAGLKFQEIQRSLKELQFTEELRLLRDDILAIYGVPKHILGITEDVNRANAEAAEYTFAKRVILPRLKRLEQQLNEFLLPQFEPDLVLEFDNPVPEDWERKIKEIEAGVKNGWLTINEARQEIGLEPLGSDFDVPWLPGNLFPAGKPAQEEKKQVKRKALSETEKEVKWKAWVTMTEPLERRMVTSLKKYFQKQQDEVMKRLKQLAPEELGAFHLLAKKKAIDVDIFLWDEDEFKQKLEELIEPLLLEIAKKAGQSVLSELDVGISFDVNHPAVRRGLKEQLQRIKGIDDTTREALREELLAGLEAGEGIAQLAERVSKVFAEAKGYRAQTIARTETNGAASLGAVEAYHQSGVVRELEWVAALDERTRPAHAAADGQRVPLGSKFKVGGEMLRFPGDPMGSAGNVINCRCTVAPITETEEE